ncbi:hypothetical protein CI610_01712 [invertebrate metagenome]|uniref:RRM domain-containing protein n=1 Tax=invertebrate metagenome TaxID=1711999 RepID=A0A2H9T802_9ZZZZ
MQNRTLYVGNLAYTADEQDLDQAFAEYGSIDDIKLMRDRETGKSRGFAFITFSEEKDAQAGLDMDGKVLSGRPLRVNPARERAPRQNYNKR